MRRSWQINMWRQDDATHSFKNYWAKSFSFLKLELCPERVTGYLEPGLMLKLFDIKPSDPCVCVSIRQIFVLRILCLLVTGKLVRLALTLKYKKH